MLITVSCSLTVYTSSVEALYSCIILSMRKGSYTLELVAYLCSVNSTSSIYVYFACIQCIIVKRDCLVFSVTFVHYTFLGLIMIALFINL